MRRRGAGRLDLRHGDAASGWDFRFLHFAEIIRDGIQNEFREIIRGGSASRETFCMELAQNGLCVWIAADADAAISSGTIYASRRTRANAHNRDRELLWIHAGGG